MRRGGHLYVYDGDNLPVEIWHLVPYNGPRDKTLCRLVNLRALRWRVTEQKPLTGRCCLSCEYPA